jgi:hypothetical protein
MWEAALGAVLKKAVWVAVKKATEETVAKVFRRKKKRSPTAAERKEIAKAADAVATTMIQAATMEDVLRYDPKIAEITEKVKRSGSRKVGASQRRRAQAGAARRKGVKVPREKSRMKRAGTHR